MFKKDCVSHIRMSEEEKNILEKASKIEGKTLSDYVRTVAVGHALSLNLGGSKKINANDNSHNLIKKKLDNIINIVLKNYTLLNKLLEKDFDKEEVIKLLKDTEEWVRESGYLD